MHLNPSLHFALFRSACGHLLAAHRPRLSGELSSGDTELKELGERGGEAAYQSLPSSSCNTTYSLKKTSSDLAY